MSLRITQNCFTLMGSEFSEHDDEGTVISLYLLVCAVGRMWFIWCWGVARLHTVRVFISTTVLPFTLRGQPTACCWRRHHDNRVPRMPWGSERAEVSIDDGKIPGSLLTSVKQICAKLPRGPCSFMYHLHLRCF